MEMATEAEPVWQKKLYVKRRLQEEETDREAFVFEKIEIGRASCRERVC